MILIGINNRVIVFAIVFSTAGFTLPLQKPRRRFVPPVIGAEYSMHIDRFLGGNEL